MKPLPWQPAASRRPARPVWPARPTGRQAALLLGALLLAASLCPGCSEDAPSARTDAAPRNVLLVVVDTLRADRLGCYGNTRGLTPNLDALADEGILFEHASAHAPWTLPSTASLLTSLYPRQHGAGGRVPDFTALAPGVETIAERFAAAGHATASIANVIFLGELFGLTRGFEHIDVRSFEDNVRMRPAAATTDAALAWLDQPHERPFLLLVHYFDPHAVYDPPQPFRRRFAEQRDREGGLRFGTREQMVGLRTGSFKPGPALVRRAEALYDGEVAYTDEQLGRLLDGLRVRGLEATTLVVVTSDHGEEFGEHGGLEHGHSLYSELLHVPLILRVPGRSAARVDTSVGLVDIAPTLCAWAGIRAPAQYVGADLLPLVEAGANRGGAELDREILAHGNFWNEPLTSWRSSGFKLILLPGGAAELYDWRLDPQELANLAAAQAEPVRRMRAGLSAAEQRFEERAATPVEMSEAELRGLESLGYTEGPQAREQ